MWPLLNSAGRASQPVWSVMALHRIVDLMRHLRGAQARLHTRVEIPFYTGRRKPVRELLSALP